LGSNDLFFSQNKELAIETPDLKIIDNSLGAVSTTSILTTQTLGDIFGGSDSATSEIRSHEAQIGDTVDSVAKFYGITPETIAWANDISKNSALKVGQTLTILPVSGVVHIVKNGDTITQISKTYKAKEEEIIAYNGLSNPQDIFIGDMLIIPNGVMPKIPVAMPAQIPLAKSFLKLPLLQATLTQGLHYHNAVDLASKCGDYVYAAAGGVVQRAVFNNKWNLGMGNYVTILHQNGVVTYYGHLQHVFVKPGDPVYRSTSIGLEGRTGQATGCHVHFEVIGAQNPFARFLPGTSLNINSDY